MTPVGEVNSENGHLVPRRPSNGMTVQPLSVVLYPALARFVEELHDGVSLPLVIGDIVQMGILKLETDELSRR